MGKAADSKFEISGSNPPAAYLFFVVVFLSSAFAEGGPPSANAEDGGFFG